MSNNKGPDIWTFSETWLSNSIQDEEIHVPGYNCVRRDREGKQGGGVAIYSVVANATLSDWLKRLALVFQPMRSKTKTNRTMYTSFFPRFGRVTGDC